MLRRILPNVQPTLGAMQKSHFGSFPMYQLLFVVIVDHANGRASGCVNDDEGSRHAPHVLAQGSTVSGTRKWARRFVRLTRTRLPPNQGQIVTSQRDGQTEGCDLVANLVATAVVVVVAAQQRSNLNGINARAVVVAAALGHVLSTTLRSFVCFSADCIIENQHEY